MAEHAPSPAAMDIRAHEKTFRGFVRFMTWAAIVSLLALVLLALINA